MPNTLKSPLWEPTHGAATHTVEPAEVFQLSSPNILESYGIDTFTNTEWSDSWNDMLFYPGDSD